MQIIEAIILESYTETSERLELERAFFFEYVVEVIFEIVSQSPASIVKMICHKRRFSTRKGTSNIDSKAEEPDIVRPYANIPFPPVIARIIETTNVYARLIKRYNAMQ